MQSSFSNVEFHSIRREKNENAKQRILWSTGNSQVQITSIQTEITTTQSSAQCSMNEML